MNRNLLRVVAGGKRINVRYIPISQSKKESGLSHILNLDCFSTSQINELSNMSSNTTAALHPDVKPFSEIPGPKVHPWLAPFMSLLTNITKQTHITMEKLLIKHGPIMKVEFGTAQFSRMVYITDVEDVEKMYRSEGKFPQSMILDLWTNAMEKHGFKRGVSLRYVIGGCSCHSSYRLIYIESKGTLTIIKPI